MGRPPLDHEALLTLALKVHAAASDSDVARMGRATRDLSVALDRHLHSEAPDLLHLAPGDARVLRRGQSRVHQLTSLLDTAARAGCRGRGGDCAVVAAELIAVLDLQARHEHHAWNRR